MTTQIGAELVNSTKHGIVKNVGFTKLTLWEDVVRGTQGGCTTGSTSTIVMSQARCRRLGHHMQEARPPHAGAPSPWQVAGQELELSTETALPRTLGLLPRSLLSLWREGEGAALAVRRPPAARWWAWAASPRVSGQHTGHITPYFRGLPPNRRFIAKKLQFAPYFAEKHPIFRQMIRFNDELSISVPCIKVFLFIIRVS